MIDGEGQQHMNWKYCRNVSWHWFILIWSVDVSERTSVPKITHTKTKRTLRARNAKRISYAKMIEMDSEGEEDDSSSDFIMSESDYSTSLGVCITSRPILVLLHLYIFCMCLFESYYAMIYFFLPFSGPDARTNGWHDVRYWANARGRSRNTPTRLQQNLQVHRYI